MGRKMVNGKIRIPARVRIAAQSSTTWRRVTWTFVQAALGFLILNLSGVTSLHGAKIVLGGAVAAGLSALKNLWFPPGSKLR